MMGRLLMHVRTYVTDHKARCEIVIRDLCDHDATYVCPSSQVRLQECPYQNTFQK